MKRQYLSLGKLGIPGCPHSIFGLDVRCLDLRRVHSFRFLCNCNSSSAFLLPNIYVLHGNNIRTSFLGTICGKILMCSCKRLLTSLTSLFSIPIQYPVAAGRCVSHRLSLYDKLSREEKFWSPRNISSRLEWLREPLPTHPLAIGV